MYVNDINSIGENMLSSTGVLGFDPEKNNHKLNFLLQAHMIILKKLSKLPEFPILASSFKKYI